VPFQLPQLLEPYRPDRPIHKETVCHSVTMPINTEPFHLFCQRSLLRVKVRAPL
jgi:hypothetical protein